MEPSIQLNREEHPEQARETQPEKKEQPKIFSQNDEASELEVSFNSFISIKGKEKKIKQISIQNLTILE